MKRLSSSIFPSPPPTITLRDQYNRDGGGAYSKSGTVDEIRYRGRGLYTDYSTLPHHLTRDLPQKRFQMKILSRAPYRHDYRIQKYRLFLSHEE